VSVKQQKFNPAKKKKNKCLGAFDQTFSVTRLNASQFISQSNSLAKKLKPPTVAT
jgi:hypothetical protein